MTSNYSSGLGGIGGPVIRVRHAGSSVPFEDQLMSRSLHVAFSVFKLKKGHTRLQKNRD